MASMTPFDPAAPLRRGVTLIEASAGTGKTHAITSLLVRLVIEEGLRIDQALVVTFTEAATAELRERVRLRLRDALRAYAGEGGAASDELLGQLRARSAAAGALAAHGARLEAALRGFDDALISTIHGFCHRVLLEHAFELGAHAAGAGLAIVADEALLREEVVRDFWVRELHRASPDFYQHLTGRRQPGARSRVDLERLVELGERVCAQREMLVLPERPESIPEPPTAAAWASAVERAAALLRTGRAEVEAALAGAALHAQLARTAPDHLDAIARWLSGDRPGPRDLPEAARRLSASYLAQRTRKGSAPPRHDFFESCERLAELAAAHRLHLDRRALDLLHRFVGFARTELGRRKRERRLVSFDDLLYTLADALRSPAGPRLVESLSARFRAVLIDEFQDTDPVQYEIFTRVFGRGDGHLFLIGDPKQAIYSFRGADVYAYLRAVEAAAGRRYTLETNWRSDARLVDALDRVFGAVAHPFAEPAIAFARVAAHQAANRIEFAGGPRPPLCVRFARLEDFPEGVSRARGPARAAVRYAQERLRRRWLAEIVPGAAAAEIADLLEAGAKIDGRALDPGDVAVLVRTNEQARETQAALRELRIPSVLHGAASVFESLEAAELRLVIAAVADPADRRRVSTALATDLLGCTLQELVELGRDERGREAQVERFRALHQLWAERGFAAMSRALVEGPTPGLGGAASNLPARLLSRIDGERRLTNLLHLAELLRRAERDLRLGPAGLLRWLDLRRLGGGDAAEDAQVRLESDERAVQLVTIHKVKGLQYPVVVCPTLWDGAALHPRDREHPRFHDPERGMAMAIDLGSERHAAHVERARYEAWAESLRLAYVALTRARNRCVVFSGAVAELGTSPLGALFHAPTGAGSSGPERLAACAAEVSRLSSASLYEQLERLASGSGGAIEATPLELRPARPWEQPRRDAPALAVRTPVAPRDRAFRTASFTALASAASALWAGAVAEGIAPDRADPDDEDDDGPRVVAPRPSDDAGARVTLHAFSRGAEAGVCLHSVLEQIDFETASPETLRPVVERELRACAVTGEPERWVDVVARGLDEAIRTPFDESGLCLSRVPRRRRLDELEFVFPVAQARRAADVWPAHLATLLRRHGGPAMPRGYHDQVARLGFEPLRGWLRGFIDLVFEHDGRWYLVDYKSNHLGDWREAYAPERLAEAMAHHHYVVQYLIYTVALHRTLGWRLPGYDYDRCFGGVVYLFLRGLSPETGPRAGVFRDRPERALVEGLSALLEAGGER